MTVSGNEMALAFDEELAGVDSLRGLLAFNSAVEPVPALPLTGAGLLALLLILLGGGRRPRG